VTLRYTWRHAKGINVADDDKVVLQQLIDTLYRDARTVSRMDAVIRAEALDLPQDLIGIVALLPPGRYPRHAMCDQLNSALKGHGWTGRYGTVD
jgi:hypothetical protein